MEEDWKRIDGYNNYAVSRYGEVQNIKTGDYLKGCVNKSGYLVIGLTNAKKVKLFPMHRLVAQAFIPNPYNKDYVRHHDGDNLNNEVLNLYWMSCEEKRIADHNIYMERIRAKTKATI